MTKIVCRKYGEELEAMTKPPFPNALGQKIQETVSQKAWDEWMKLQTMLINEKHLKLFDAEAKQFLNAQRELFFDNGDYEQPQSWTPES